MINLSERQRDGIDEDYSPATLADAPISQQVGRLGFPPLAAPENEATQGFSAPSVTPRDLPRESLAVIVGIDSFEVESFFRQASRLMAKVQTGPDGIRKSAASNRGLEVDRVDGARGHTR